jgi:hypothetical protein
MVKALVLTRKAGLADSSDSLGIKGMRSDLIRGKGDGLIMLLHGGPGTGKTLTAGMTPDESLISHSLLDSHLTSL